MRKRNKHFCRLYKYRCSNCGKERHRRHFAKPGEVCPTCTKGAKIDEAQVSLFVNPDIK